VRGGHPRLYCERLYVAIRGAVAIHQSVFGECASSRAEGIPARGGDAISLPREATARFHRGGPTEKPPATLKPAGYRRAPGVPPPQTIEHSCAGSILAGWGGGGRCFFSSFDGSRGPEGAYQDHVVMLDAVIGRQADGVRDVCELPLRNALRTFNGIMVACKPGGHALAR